MILVADEGVDRAVVDRLRRDGHDVVYVAELSPSIPDAEVLREANSRRAVLVTGDKDFGELVFRQGLVHSGVQPTAWGGACSGDGGGAFAPKPALHGVIADEPPASRFSRTRAPGASLPVA